MKTSLALRVKFRLTVRANAIWTIMGSVCCVPAKKRTHPNRTEGMPYDGIRSPSWNFQWDNRQRVSSEIGTPYQVSRGISTNDSMELKGALSSERGNFSDLGSPLENFGTPISQKSPVHGGTGTNLSPSPGNVTPTVWKIGSPHDEVKSLTESLAIANSFASNVSLSMPTNFSTPTAEPSRTPSYPLFPNSTPSRRARCSPGHQLLRQVSDSRIKGLSDSRIWGLKSPNNNSISEGRQSFVLSTCRNDLATGSLGGSSDGWSMRTFSELVAYSQRERWSFDSENFGSIHDLQSCGVYSKLLTERSSWSIQKIIAGSDTSVVSVLVCGHLYHAECLETMTLEVDKYDPACPICMVGEKQVLKMSRKALRAEAELKAKNLKISKNRVNNADRKGKVSKMEPSSSTRNNSAKPFLKRHFWLGSRWSRSLSENDYAKRKCFISKVPFSQNSQIYVVKTMPVHTYVFANSSIVMGLEKEGIQFLIWLRRGYGNVGEGFIKNLTGTPVDSASSSHRHGQEVRCSAFSRFSQFHLERNLVSWNSE
ncbi:unnamed protein product [Malus baccata var. baccata]